MPPNRTTGITSVHEARDALGKRLRELRLDRLVSFSSLPNVKLGIIGFETAYVVAPAHGFWLLDNDRVMVETFSAELNLAQPQELSLYSGIFDSLAAVASYGRSARTIINRVVDDLATDASENGE